MARARNIKPGFFKNEDLAECSPWARLCFAGLWTLADREGRLEDRPKRIKGELFAFDSVEVEPLLVELEKHGFILRYAVEGLGFIQILAFHKHQNPHHKEPKSVIPSPESPGLLPHGMGGESGASPPLHDTKAQDKPEALGSTSELPSTQNRADTKPLIPDSPIRNTDPGTHTTDVGRVCRAMRQAGMADVQTAHPDLLALIAVGATEPEFVGAAQTAVDRGKGFAYALGILKRQREDAAKAAASMHRGPMPKANDRASRQLETAALMTGAKRAAQPPETIDVDARVIPA